MSDSKQAAPKPREKAVSFSRPEQIYEILAEANRLRLQVLIKYANDGKAVRGFIENCEKGDYSLRIGGISSAGDALLKTHDLVRVEFILLSRKLVFVANVKARVPGKLLLKFPEKLIAIERRHNTRFKIPESASVFAEFPDKLLDLQRYDAPFVPAGLREPGSQKIRLKVDDVSLGGVACFTRYATIAELLKSEDSVLDATLYFPEHPPLIVPVTIRWTKKTIARIQQSEFEIAHRILARRLGKPAPPLDGLELKETYYRLGLQFAEVSKNLDLALRSFIRVVQTAESV